MLKTFACLPLFLLFPFFSWGCFCVSLGIQKDYERSDVVFIGRLMEKQEIEFFFTGRYPDPLQVFQFEVLEISKGLHPADSRISLIDRYHSSSCNGLFYHQEVGDTILVFANKTSLSSPISIVSSTSCYGNIQINDLEHHDSLGVIRQLPWDSVQFNDAIFYYEQEKKTLTEKEAPNNHQSNAKLYYLLAASAFFNLIILINSFRQKQRSR